MATEAEIRSTMVAQGSVDSSLGRWDSRDVSVVIEVVVVVVVVVVLANSTRPNAEVRTALLENTGISTLR